MNTTQLTKYVTELIQIVNTNIVLANDISKQLGLPVNESLKQFNQNFRKYLLKDVPNNANASNTEIINENTRLREEVNYINASSRRQKHDFTECSAALRDELKKLEKSLKLTQNDQAKCNERLKRAKDKITTSNNELLSCRKTNREYTKELEILRQRLLDESDAYRQKIDASNAMSQMHLSDVETENQAKINNYIKTITELRGRIYELNAKLKQNDEEQAMLMNQSTDADIDRIETLESDLKLAKESLTQATKQHESMQNEIASINEEKVKALDLIKHLEDDLQTCKDALGRNELSLNSLNEKIQTITEENIKLVDELQVFKSSLGQSDTSLVSLNEQIQNLNDEKAKLVVELLVFKDLVKKNELKIVSMNEQTLMLNAEKTNLIDKISELKIQINNLRDQNFGKNQLTIENDESVKKIESLENALRVNREHLAQIQRRCADAQKELEVERSENMKKTESFEYDIKASKRSLDEINKKYISIQNQLESDRSEAITEIEQLTNELKSCKDTLRVNQESLDQTNERYIDIQNQLDNERVELNNVSTYSQNQFDVYNDKIKQLEGKLRVTEISLDKTNKQSAAVSEQLDIEKRESMEKIKRLEAALKAKDEHLDRVKQQYDDMEKQLAIEKRESIDKIGRLEHKLNSNKQILDELNPQYNITENQHDITNRELMETIRRLESEIKSNKEMLEHANQQSLNMQTQIDALENDKREALRKIAYLETEAKRNVEFDEPSATLITTLNAQKGELMNSLQESKLQLQKTEESLVALNERITQLSNDKIELAKLLQDSKQTISNLQANHKKIIVRGIERFKNTIRSQISDLVASIDSYDDKQLRIHVKQIISELSTETGAIALLMPRKIVASDYSFTDDELNDLTTKLTNATLEQRRQLIERFLRKKLDAVTDYYQLQLEAAQANVVAETKCQNTDYKKLIDDFMETKRSEDFEILLKHEIRKRDGEIERLTKLIQNIPESQLNERIRDMSSVRKNELVEVLTKFSTKISPYDSNLGNQLKTSILKLNREFDEIFDYIDNIVSILIEINISGFSKLAQTFDQQTLNDLSMSLREMRKNIELNSPHLDEEFSRLLSEIQTTIDFIGDSSNVEAGMIEQNNKIATEAERINYQEILKEVTAFRDDVSAEKTRLIRHRLSALMDMEKLEDSNALSPELLDPINYFIIVDELELTKSNKSKLLNLFKNLIERNQTKVDELTKRLQQIDRDLSDSKAEVQTSKQTIADMQKKLSSNEQLVISLQDELVKKNAIINDLQSTKKQQETLKLQLDESSGDVESMSAVLGSISTILKKYTELCRSSTNSNGLLEQINTISATMPLKTAVSVLDSISKLLSPLVEESRAAKELSAAQSVSRKRRISSDDESDDGVKKTKPKVIQYSDDEGIYYGMKKHKPKVLQYSDDNESDDDEIKITKPKSLQGINDDESDDEIETTKPNLMQLSDDEEDLIAMNNQQMYMQMVYGGKSATESKQYADATIEKLKKTESVKENVSSKSPPVRRSVRKTQKAILEDKQRDIERKILHQVEDGLKVEQFPVKGRGVVTTRKFTKGEFVVEYIGELIDQVTAKKREELYAQDQNKGCYMYYFQHRNRQYCIDATEETGKLGRLINHSRNGNLVTRVVDVESTPHLIFMSKEDISVGTEVTYDYGDRNRETICHNPWLAL